MVSEKEVSGQAEINALKKEEIGFMRTLNAEARTYAERIGYTRSTMEQINLLKQKETDTSNRVKSISDKLLSYQKTEINNKQKMINLMSGVEDPFWEEKLRIQNELNALDFGKYSMAQALVGFAGKELKTRAEELNLSNEEWEGQIKHLEVMKSQFDTLTEIKNKQDEINENLKKREEITKKYTKYQDTIKEQWVNIKQTTIAIATNPMALIGASMMLIVGLAKKLWGEFIKVDGAVGDIAKQTGIGINNFDNLHKTVANVRGDFVGMGMGVAEITEAAVSLTKEFQRTNLVTEDNLKLMGEISHYGGVSVDESVKLVKQLSLVTGSFQDAARFAREMSEAPGVTADVMNDIAGLSGDALGYFGGSTDELRDSAIFARRLGLEIGTLTKVADNLLDFESSIQSEMEASVLIGRQLNLNKARQYAWDGDMLNLGKELVKQAGSLDDFNRMKPIQQKAFAKAMGMEVSEMRRMMMMQEMGFGDLHKSQEQMKTNWTKIKLKFDKFVVALSEKLMPYVNELIGKFDKWVSDDNLEKAAETIKDIGKALLGIGKVLLFVVKNWKLALVALIAYKIAMRGLSGSSLLFGDGMSKSLKKSGSAIKGLGASLAGLAKKGGSAMKNFGKSLMGPAGKFFSSKGSSNMSKSLKRSGSAMKGFGGSLKGALGTSLIMIAFAAAIWILAKAFTEFNNVTWKGLFVGITAMAAFVAAMVVLGSIATTATPVIWPLIAVMFALAGVMYILGHAFKLFGEALALTAPFITSIFEGIGFVIESIGNSIATVIDSITSGIVSVSNIPTDNIFKLTGAIISLAGALTAFSAAGLLALPVLAGLKLLGFDVGDMATKQTSETQQPNFNFDGDGSILVHDKKLADILTTFSVAEPPTPDEPKLLNFDTEGIVNISKILTGNISELVSEIKSLADALTIFNEAGLPALSALTELKSLSFDTDTIDSITSSIANILTGNISELAGEIKLLADTLTAFSVVELPVLPTSDESKSLNFDAGSMVSKQAVETQKQDFNFDNNGDVLVYDKKLTAKMNEVINAINNIQTEVTIDGRKITEIVGKTMRFNTA